MLEETKSKEWLAMASVIAKAFWDEPLRTSQKSEIARYMSWDLAKQEYRSLVRFVLRQGEKEGIKFRKNKDSAIDSSASDWNNKTSRLAVRLWLRSNKSTERIQESDLLPTMRKEAFEYRKYVRKVIKDLGEFGIFLQQ